MMLKTPGKCSVNILEKKCLFVVYNFGWQHCSRITTWFSKTSIDSSVWQQSFVGFWLINQSIRICRWTVQNFTQKKCWDVYVPNFSARPFAANHQPMFGSMYKEKKNWFCPLERKKAAKNGTINLLLKSSPPCLPLKIASLGWFQHFCICMCKNDVCIFYFQKRT